MKLREKHIFKDTKIWTIIPTMKVITEHTDYKKSLTFEFWFLHRISVLVFAK